jgi:hypothetical protein
MWDAVGVVWDWASKMGLGGLTLWLAQRWLATRDKAVERGRQLVDDARPELEPLTNAGGQYSIALTLENRGKGTASVRRIGFTGVQAIETKTKVPAGRRGTLPEYHVHSSPFFTREHGGDATIAVVYADRFGNEYSLSIPVTRTPRADSGFNMVLHFSRSDTRGPTLSKKHLRKIGTG